MSDAPLLVGIDAGTTRIRALVFTAEGRFLAQGSSPTPTERPRPDWAQHDPEALWQALVAALREALGQIDDPRRIKGLAVASVGEAVVPLDARGEPTFAALAWFDQRTRAQVERLQAVVGHERLFAITGMSLEPMAGLCKLLWLKDNQPEAFARTVRCLNIADYLAWRLCGEAATDYSLASRTLALDLRSLRWSEELLREVGIDPGLFQALRPSGAHLGTVSAAAARATGLPEHCAVGVGGHDHIVGALAVGAWTPGTLLDSLGTAEALLLAREQPVFSSELVRRGYGQGAMVVDEPRYYMVGAMTTSGACVEWFREAVAGGAEHGELIAEARRVPPGSLGAYFFPHMRVGAPPHPGARARGAFLGLSPDVKRGALYRALLEGLAFDARSVVEGWIDLEDIPAVERILAIGGDSRNRLLMQIKAAVFGRSIEIVDLAEAVSLGAALLGGLAGGVYAGVEQALAQLVTGHRTVQPEAGEAAIYESLYRAYKQIPAALAPLHRSLQHRVDKDKWTGAESNG